jgi:hypothetical protein
MKTTCKVLRPGCGQRGQVSPSGTGRDRFLADHADRRRSNVELLYGCKDEACASADIRWQAGSIGRAGVPGALSLSCERHSAAPSLSPFESSPSWRSQQCLHQTRSIALICIRCLCSAQRHPSASSSYIATSLPPSSLLRHVVDVHCHPTDTGVNESSQNALPIRICAMASRRSDQSKVAELARSRPDKIIPCFGELLHRATRSRVTILLLVRVPSLVLALDFSGTTSGDSRGEGVALP